MISTEKPCATLIPGERENISRHAEKRIPVAHEWSKTGVEHKTKTDTCTLSYPYDRGYGPQSSPALNAADGQPLSVLAQNPVIKDTVYSSYGNSGKMSHLGGFGLRMAHIAAQKPSHGKTKPYP